MDRKESDIIINAINDWVREGKLSSEKAEELKQDVAPKDSNRRQIAQYFFIVSVSCILLSFGAIFIDDKLLERVKQYFELNNIVIALVFTLLSVAWFTLIHKRRANYSKAVFEVYSTAGALLVLTALVYYCKDIGNGDKYSGFLALTAMALFILSRVIKSDVLWLGGILGTMGWYGSFTAAYSQKDLFLGMNYPVRFTIFGAIVLGASWLQRKVKSLSDTQRLTYIAGLIILLTGMWGVSVFGNYSNLEEWAKVRQIHIIVYSIVFAAISALLFYLGIKNRDSTTRDIAVIALLINLYSRYFEFFWDTTNKGIFFLILAVSFWFIGRRIEKYKKNQPQQTSH